MCEADWLGVLEVREPRKNCRRLGTCDFGDPGLQEVHFAAEVLDIFHQSQTTGCCHLIIAAAGGVQFSGNGADFFF